MKSNTYRYAKQELDILAKTVPDAIVTPFAKEILLLAEKFGKSGQSGGSAPFTATAISQAIKKVLLQEPICEITGIAEEWTLMDEKIYQNNRCYALFKEGAKGKPYYLDAIIFKTQKGHTYSSNCGALLKNGEKVYSRQYVKKFPFSPKTFYIDVIENEIAKDDWEFHIKNPKQLDAVFKYYNKFDK